ncbi:hypothetical protein KR018_003553, partial [Drosophila ironensis]
ASKQRLKEATRLLDHALHQHEENAQLRYIQNLSPTSTKFPLWKAHQNLSAPIETTTPIRNSSGCWARSDKDRAETFATHLQSVFQPNPASNSFVLTLIQPEATPLPTTPPLRPNEIEKVIRGLKPKKAPGGDLLTPKMLIELSKCAIDVICKLFNGIINLGYFPKKWKKSIIIMIPKPGKDHTIPTSTIEQCHRIVEIIKDAFEKKDYCATVFLDVKQAFDKVWHLGMLYKIKKWLPAPYFMLLKSYLSNRNFYVQQNDEHSEIYAINAGVPQGSVLGPVLYTVYTADLP